MFLPRMGALALCLFLWFGPASSSTARALEIPPLRAAVTDQAEILSRTTERQLEAALGALREQGGTQLAVLTLPDLAGLSIEQASIQIVDAWKLGSEKQDDGVLLLVASAERRVRIEVGQGLEGVLTDAHSKRIIDESITPLFREGDMDAGVVVGVYQIAAYTNPDVDLRPYLEGRLRAPRDARRREASPLQIIFFVAIVLFVMAARMGLLPFLLGASVGRMGGRHHRGGWGGGLGGGGFGGGGFGGGGGGFSGGGASGGW